MKAFVNPDRCIGCGICASVSPAVFGLGGDEKSHPIDTPIPEGSLKNALSAKERCPARAIAIRE